MGKARRKETHDDHCKNLITLEKNCDFKDIKQEDLLVLNFDTSITAKITGEVPTRENTNHQNNYRANNPKQLRPTTQTIYSLPPALAKGTEIKSRKYKGNETKNTTIRNTKLATTAKRRKKETTVDSVGNKTGNQKTFARQKPQNATTAKN